MKKLIYWMFKFFLFSFILLFINCTEKEVVVPITVSLEEVKLVASEQSQFVTIDSKSAWKVKSHPTWCVLTDSTGTGSKTISLYFYSNTTGAVRTATLLIENGSDTKNVLITQDGGQTMILDNFDGNLGWYNVETDSITMKINNGLFSFSNTCIYYGWLARMNLVADYTGNYIISTKFTQPTSNLGSFGLLIAGDATGNYYCFYINPYNKSYSIYKYQNSIWTKIGSSTTTVILYNNNSGTSENAISMVKSGNYCHIYINDKKVNSFDLSLPFGGRTGFKVDRNSAFSVDYLKIIKI